MTTLPACLTPDVCVNCGVARQHHDVPENRLGINVGCELFVPHEHVRGACSAAFFETMFGCVVDTNGRCTRSDQHAEDVHHRHYGGETPTEWAEPSILPDPIASPESAEAWQAARDVIDEVHRRGWYMLIETDADPAHNVVRVLDSAINGSEANPMLGEIATGELPRAIVLAAWSAKLEEGN